MVRKKQQNPRPLLGPPESRQSSVEADVLDHTPAPSSQNGRSRSGGPFVFEEILTASSVNAASKSDVLPLRHIQIDCSDLTTFRRYASEPSLRLSIASDLEDSTISWSVGGLHAEGCNRLNVSQGQVLSAQLRHYDNH